MKERLLLHVCCAPCSIHVLDCLKKYNVTLYFYNPNIHPRSEYNKRLKDVVNYASIMSLDLFIYPYMPRDWFGLVEANYLDKEGGQRCLLCFRFRLERTAMIAKYKYNISNIATTLSISPYKNREVLRLIGNEVAGLYSIDFIDEDYRKNNGFNLGKKRSVELGMYRQRYCGCIFSNYKNKNR